MCNGTSNVKTRVPANKMGDETKQKLIDLYTMCGWPLPWVTDAKAKA